MQSGAFELSTAALRQDEKDQSQKPYTEGDGDVQCYVATVSNR